MAELPSGTVTFLFTDIEGSTRLWEAHPEAMRATLLQHDDLLRACIESHGGRVFKTVGDAFCAAFPEPRPAVATVLAAQQWLPALALDTESGPQPLKVRMALHTGVVEERDGDYFGPPLNRIARLLAIAHGGQILLSAAAQGQIRDDLPAGASLRDMGPRRLKDLIAPEQVFQLLHPDLAADFPPLRSLDTRGHNLPVQATSFIGREREMQEVKALLGVQAFGRSGLQERRDSEGLKARTPERLNARLVTLTGSGGCGKTRLSLQVAADLIDDSADGVWLIELAALRDPELVAPTVAQTLNIREEPGIPVLDTLASQLSQKQLLLVLDNCEHLVEACAVLCQKLLAACASVRLLTSSREVLRIPGEAVYRVPSLSIPDPSRHTTPERLSPFETVQLFVDRALLVQPSFTVTPANAPALASVCHRLDGIPLALELAAARVRAMPVEQIEQRLDQRFRLLTGGSRTALPRQQTLRSLIDWSYDLLNPAEQSLLRRLSVFAGGWTLEAAEAVCAGEVEGCLMRVEGPDRTDPSTLNPQLSTYEVLDLLTSLCDKSLLVYSEASGGSRYRVLETVRQYGRERLGESGEEREWRARHQAHFLALAEEAQPHLTGPEQGAWHDRLETEHDNLRAALEFALAECSLLEDEGALRLAGSLNVFWLNRGYLGEGRRWLGEALAAGDSSVVSVLRARVFHGAGNFAYLQTDFPAAQQLYQQAAAMWRALGDLPREAKSLGNLATVAQAQGDHEAARLQFERTLAILEEVEDEVGIATTLSCLGNLTTEQGNAPAARAYLARALALTRKIGNRILEANVLANLGSVEAEAGNKPAAREAIAGALALNEELGCRLEAGFNRLNLATVHLASGDRQSARSRLREAIGVFSETGSHRMTPAWMEAWAGMEMAEGRPARSARLFGAARRLREQIGVPMLPKNVALREEQAAQLRSALTDEGFEREISLGQDLSLEQAIAYALEEVHD